jgi:peroxiredoxin
MKRILIVLLVVLWPLSLLAEGYGPGDKAMGFELKNVDGRSVSLDDYAEAKGFIVIFTCNTCPYAVAYEDRIIDLDNTYRPMGMPVIAVNPNDPSISPGDSYDKMIERAKEKNFTFPYLFDETQEIFKAYGATRTPHVYLLEKDGSDLIVKYVGTIDDNYKDASQVQKTYLADAVDAVLQGQDPDPSLTKAIGCTIKYKK